MGMKRVVLAAAIGLWAAAPVFGQAAISLGVSDHDTSQPIEITSEELQVNQADGAATFIGDVIIGQGEMRLTAGQVRVEYAPNPDTGETEISVIRASGGVTIVGPSEAAESRDAVYQLEDSVVVMTGDVLVTQGLSAISGDRLTYNLDTGEGRMEGRVKTVLQTGSN